MVTVAKGTSGIMRLTMMNVSENTHPDHGSYLLVLGGTWQATTLAERVRSSGKAVVVGVLGGSQARIENGERESYAHQH
jgi:hypothetical protein